jgi:hypothetical protein
VTIYRVIEPTIRGAARVTIDAVEALRVRYPRGAHDVEAMAVRDNGTVMLVTKGRSGGVLLYEVGPEAWGSNSTVVATRVDSLPISANGGMGRLITDMAINPAGTKLAVRTYRDVFVFDRSPSGTLVPRLVCDILGREPQGEGIAWLPDGRLLLVSERGLFQRGPINTMTCG